MTASNNLNNELCRVTAELNRYVSTIDEESSSCNEPRNYEVRSIFDDCIEDCRNEFVSDSFIDCEDTWREFATIKTGNNFDSLSFKQVRALAFAAFEFKRDIDQRVLQLVERLVD